VTKVYDFGGSARGKIAVALHFPDSTAINNLPPTPAGRVNHLLHVVGKANSELKKVSDPDTLPVFVAPESYFRDVTVGESAVSHHYERKWFYWLVEKLGSQCAKYYPVMLVIPGSIQWKDPRAHREEYEDLKLRVGTRFDHLTDEEKPRVLEMCHNTAPVFFNKKTFFYTKQVSAGDHVESLGQMYVNTPSTLPIGLWCGIFRAAGMTFGLRICADDGLFFSQYIKAVPEGMGIDFHILIAQGAGVTPASAVAKDGGWLIRVDCEKPKLEEACTVSQVRRPTGVFEKTAATLVDETGKLKVVDADPAGRLAIYPAPLPKG
jgi:hypothetical protein